MLITGCVEREKKEMKTWNVYEPQELSELPVSLPSPIPHAMLSHLHLFQVKTKCFLMLAKLVSVHEPFKLPKQKTAKIPLINSPSLTSGTNSLFFKVKDFLLHLICMDMTWGESLIHHALTLIIQPNSSAWSKGRENEKVFRIGLKTNQPSKQTKKHNRSGGESGYPSPLLCNQELW